MALSDIPAKPVPAPKRCNVCTWLKGLDKNDQDHFNLIAGNYPVSTLHRVLTEHASAPFSSDVLRKHLRDAH